MVFIQIQHTITLLEKIIKLLFPIKVKTLVKSVNYEHFVKRKTETVMYRNIHIE